MGGFVELGDYGLAAGVVRLWREEFADWRGLARGLLTIVWSRRRRSRTSGFFGVFEEEVKEGGCCCDVFRTFCSTGLRSGRRLRNPFFGLDFSFFFFLGYDIGRTFINRVFVVRSLIMRRGIEEVNRLNWMKNESVKPPLQFLLWYGSKQKKGPPLFPAVVVVVKGEKIKVKKSRA